MPDQAAADGLWSMMRPAAMAAVRARGEEPMSWQLKGWLLLTFALLATALVAGTAGAGARPSAGTAVLASPSATAAWRTQPPLDMRITKIALRWQDR